MNRLLFIFLLSFFVQPAAFAQKNLVPNGDFEHVIAMPKGVSNFPLARPWSSTAQGTEPADLYHKNTKAVEVAIPLNYMGSQEPYSGEAYAGIAVLRKGKQDYREFMQVQLTEPLQKNTEYEAEMYVSLSDYSELATNSLSLFFSAKAPLLIQNGYVFVKPQITPDAKNIIDDKNGWVKIGGKFKATGGETVLTIGNFTAQNKTAHKKVKSTRKETDKEAFAYYYIDAIKLTKAGESGEPLVATTSTYFGDVSPKKPVTLHNIFFRTDEAVLLPASFQELDKLAEFLTQNPTLKISINGHTDNTSTPEYNQTLSEARAVAVKNFLVNKGINASAIQVNGFGSTKPVADNNTEKGKQQNRRVEFEVISN